MRCACFFGCLLALAPSTAVPADGPRIEYLRCENLQDPLGIDATSPRLSWVLGSAERGQRQTACQVLVASSPERLAQGQGDLWDSGKVAGDETAWVVYGGRPLASRQTCHWKVRAWGRDARPGAWSAPARWEMGLLKPDDWSAQWIAGQVQAAPGMSRPVPILRKSFRLAEKPLAKARLFATAQGLYELHLNGIRVGDRALAPDWTDDRDRVRYQVYDVSNFLQPGENVLAGLLATGWSSGHIGHGGFQQNGTEPALLAQLEVTYGDGSTERCTSDATWKVHASPILASDFMLGEAYDARREVRDWDQPGLDTSAWPAAKERRGRQPMLEGQVMEPVRKIGLLEAKSVAEPKPGRWTFDLGRNMVGAVQLVPVAPAGTQLTLRYAEMLNPDGTVDATNLCAATAADTYVCKGGGFELWQPIFTCHGFRYVEVTGLPSKPTPDALAGVVIGSSTPRAGEFPCSDPRIKQFQSNVASGPCGNPLGVAASARLPAAAEKISIWSGCAPRGDGTFESADAVITVHRPAPERANGAAVVICPGGSYAVQVIGAEGHGIAEWLNRHGIAGIVLEYRFPKARPFVPLLDAQRAIRTVRFNAKRWKIDPGRIGIIGFSAGGHLASTAATHFDAGDPQAADPIDRLGCRPDFAILVYATIMMGERSTHRGTGLNLLGPHPKAELLDFFSNQKHVSDRTPPIFLAHAKDDAAVVPEHSRVMYQALKAHGVATEYLELPQGGHGLNHYQGPMWDAWQKTALEFLAARKIIPRIALVSDAVRQSDYRGWKTLELSNGLVELQVAPQIGGRVIQYRLGRFDFFWVNAQLAGKQPPESGLAPDGSFLNYGGEKLWPAPQGWDNTAQWPGPPDAVLDGSPHEGAAAVKQGQPVIMLRSRKDPRSGIQFSRTIRLFDGSTHVHIDATMTNIDNKPRRWGIWSNAQQDAANRGGNGYDKNLHVYCPINPKSKFSKGYRVMFGDADNPSFQLDAKRGIMHVHYQRRVGKIALDSPAGWLATVHGTAGRVFVQRFRHDAAQEYPDNASVEIWLNGVGKFFAWGKVNESKDDPIATPSVIEAELLSPLAALKPGEQYTFGYDWYAASIGGDFPVVDCNDMGVVCDRLAARLIEGRLVLGGRFGLFCQATAAIAFVAEGKTVGEPVGRRNVSPLAPLVFSRDEKLPAPPPGTEAISVRLYGADGRLLGELARVGLARPVVSIPSGT